MPQNERLTREEQTHTRHPRYATFYYELIGSRIYPRRTRFGLFLFLAFLIIAPLVLSITAFILARQMTTDNVNVEITVPANLTPANQPPPDFTPPWLRSTTPPPRRRRSKTMPTPAVVPPTEGNANDD
jgi:hypothetical protein